MTTVKAKVQEKGRKTDEESYLVDPLDISIIEGFNASNRTDDVSDLIHLIEKDGVLQSLQGYEEDGQFFLTSGHRRLECAIQLIKAGKWKHGDVRFVFRPKKDALEQLFDVFTFNSGSKPLTELQEAEMFQRLIAGMPEKGIKGMKQEEIADRICKTQALISQRLKLLKLTKYLKGCLIGEIMSAHAAQQIHEIHETETEQKDVVEKILIKKSKLKGNGVTFKQAVTELKKIGRCKISVPEIPKKRGGQKNPLHKRTSKNQKMFREAVEYMKTHNISQIKINKLEIIAKALEANTPGSMVKTIMTVI